MESHGGYLIKGNAVDPRLLVHLARRALYLDGQHPPYDVSLAVGFLPARRIIRLAYDAPFTYGRRGARWYETHHALARLASGELGAVVHAYMCEEDEVELVVAYGDGVRVGGERLELGDWEPRAEDLDEAAFEREKERWPLGHLARIYGATRQELVKMARYAPTVLLDVDAPGGADLQAVESLWFTPLSVPAP